MLRTLVILSYISVFLLSAVQSSACDMTIDMTMEPQDNHAHAMHAEHHGQMPCCPDNANEQGKSVCAWMCAAVVPPIQAANVQQLTFAPPHQFIADNFTDALLSQYKSRLLRPPIA